MSGTLFTPDIGARLNQEDVSGVSSTPSWLAYDGSLDGAKVTIGTSTSTTSCPVDCISLSSTRAMISFADSANSNFATVALIDTSGTTPSLLGSVLVLNAATTRGLRISDIDSRYAAIIYEASGAKGRIIDKDSGGTDIIGAVGSEQDLSTNIGIPASTNNIDIDLLDSTHIVAAYQDSASSDLAASVITVNTGTGSMTDNTEVVMHAGTMITDSFVQVNCYDSTHFIACTGMTTTSGVLTAGSVSGTTITKLDSETPAFGSSNLQAVGPVWVAGAETFIGCCTVENQQSNAGPCLVASYDDTAGSSAITFHRAVNLTGIIDTLLIRTESVDGNEYFIMATKNDDGAGVRNIRLRGAEFDTTKEIFNFGTDIKSTDINTSSDDLDQTSLGLCAISTTKALIICPEQGDSSKIKIFMANQ